MFCPSPCHALRHKSWAHLNDKSPLATKVISRQQVAISLHFCIPFFRATDYKILHSKPSHSTVTIWVAHGESGPLTRMHFCVLLSVLVCSLLVSAFRCSPKVVHDTHTMQHSLNHGRCCGANSQKTSQAARIRTAVDAGGIV